MSALTDLFSALANKIRSKTGGSDTYTPLEMVQDGIDDVYDAGVEAGTPTLTGDATASDVKSGKTFYGSTLTKQTGTFAADTVNNSATATTSQATKSPASGKYFADFTVNPQQHSETYTPAANTSANNMGAVHNYRYVNTSGMIVPSGAKSITANGTGIDVSSYATANVNVPNPTLSGDAVVGNVLSGKTFYNSDYTKRTGTMTNNGDGSATLNCGGSKVLSAGYYSGGTISANSLASQTGVDSGKTAIDASHVLSGYQGWVNGSKISGTYSAPTITDITLSDDTSFVSLATTGNYHPTSAGYAIKKYTSIIPSDTSPVAITTGYFYRPTKGGYVILNTPTSITPDDVTIRNINKNTIYRPTESGYVIKTSPTSITPSASGTEFSEGIVKMSDGGYAYSERPSKTVTTLWTNSSPTSSFAQKDLTGLSSGISNFDYIKITYRWGKSDATSQSATFAVDEIPSSTGRAGIGMRVGTATRFRPIYKSSNTSIYFYGAYSTSSTSASSDYVIPTEIEGIKYNGIS